MESSSWLFSLGDLNVRLFVIAPDRYRELDQWAEQFKLTEKVTGQDEWQLAIVRPFPLDGPLSSPGLSARDNRLWQKWHQVWHILKYPIRFSELQLTPAVFEALPWLEPWDVAMPDFILLGYNRGDQKLFFGLILPVQDQALIQQIVARIYILATWWHLLRGGLPLHSAGMFSDPTRGYLVLGAGGAGKSTVSQLAHERGMPVLSDDQIIVMRNDLGRFSLCALPNPSGKTFTTAPHQRPTLRAIFTLVKDQRDYLVRLPRMRVLTTIWKAFLWNSGSGFLPRELRLNAARLAIELANQVPGYELHFRKTPEFWDIINAEFSSE